MSYREMSNREGNLQRIVDMNEAKMPHGVIAAYMTTWGVPMTAPDVRSVVNTFDALGNHAVKKADVQQAIAVHRRFIEPLIAPSSNVVQEEEDFVIAGDDGDDEDEDEDSL